MQKDRGGAPMSKKRDEPLVTREEIEQVIDGIKELEPYQEFLKHGDVVASLRRESAPEILSAPCDRNYRWCSDPGPLHPQHAFRVGKELPPGLRPCQ